MILPPLPATIFSTYGPIPVEVVHDLSDPETGEPIFGWWDPFARVIKIRAHLHPAAALSTLYHEQTHAWMADIGVRLTTAQEESIANAVAAARLAELLDSLRGSP